MPKKTGISDEDRDLFRKAVQDVKPLQNNTSRLKSSTVKSDSVSALQTSIKASHATTATIKKMPFQQWDDVSTFVPLSSYIVETVQSDTILSFRHPNLNKKQWDMLKKGQYPIEAKLDLHGYTPNDAQAVLSAFIAKQQQLRQRHILIVHGKGGQHGDAPILKNLVNRWLPQFSQVLGFHSALAKHGGSGALYVLLTRV